MFLVFNALGTPTQTAVQKYRNSKKVPQLFLATGASKWNDPKAFPWTMGFQPSCRVEARIFAETHHAGQTRRQGRGVLRQ